MAKVPVSLYLQATGKGGFSALVRRGDPVSLSLLISVSIVFRSSSMGQTGLEDYLKGLGYEPVAFKVSDSNEALVQGQLDTGKTVTLNVDTGWRFTTLDPAKEAGLKTLGETGAVLEDSFLGKITNRSVALIKTLLIGRAQFINQPALVRELKMDNKTVDFQGILGLDFLFRNFCLIDCGGRRIYLRGSRPSEQQAGALQESLRRSGFAEVSMQPLLKDGLSVAAQVNDQPVTLLVDTGGIFSFLDDTQVKRLGLRTVKQEQPATGTFIRQDASAFAVGVGKIGTHTMRVTTLNSLQLGTLKWNNVYVGVVDLKSWSMAKAGTPHEGVQGLLGFEFLAEHGVVIDVAGRKLWFRPAKPPRR